MRVLLFLSLISSFALAKKDYDSLKTEFSQGFAPRLQRLNGWHAGNCYLEDGSAIPVVMTFLAELPRDFDDNEFSYPKKITSSHRMVVMSSYFADFRIRSLDTYDFLDETTYGYFLPTLKDVHSGSNWSVTKDERYIMSTSTPNRHLKVVAVEKESYLIGEVGRKSGEINYCYFYKKIH